MVVPVPGPSLRDIANVFKSLLAGTRRGRRWLARKRFSDGQSSRNSEALYQYLEWRYQASSLLQRDQFTYPVAVYPTAGPQRGLETWISQRDDPNSALPQRSDPCRLRQSLKTASWNHPEHVEIQDEEYRANLIAAEYFRDPDLNRKTFAMDALRISPRLELQCYLGNYFDNVDTCDALEWELLANTGKLSEFDDNALAAFEQKWLPLRSELHRRVANPVRDGAFRCPGIGISTLIAYEDDYGLQLMVKKRSDTKVAAHPGGIHVIPSFMFQPGTEQWPEEFSITHNILREYLEELFSVAESGDRAVSAKYFYGDPRMRYLLDLLARGEAQMYLSGIAVNLLTLRPEVCTVLHIRTRDWWAAHEVDFEDDDGKKKTFRLQPNEEFDDFLSAKEVVGNIPYSEDDSDLLAASERALLPSRMVPSGAAAFWLGVDVLRDVLRQSQVQTQS